VNDRELRLAEALIVAVCIHWGEPVGADVVISRCLRIAQAETDISSLSQKDFRHALAQLTKRGVIFSASLSSLVDDYGTGLGGDADEIIGIDTDIISLGKAFPNYVDSYFKVLENIAVAHELKFDLSVPTFGLGDAIPAADRYVSRTDNVEKIDDTVQKIESALEVIKSSNTLDPEDKSLWVDLISQGLENFKKPKVIFGVIGALVTKPLYDAYASVLEESSKPIIKAAIDAIMSLFGMVA